MLYMYCNELNFNGCVLLLSTQHAQHDRDKNQDQHTTLLVSRSSAQKRHVGIIIRAVTDEVVCSIQDMPKGSSSSSPGQQLSDACEKGYLAAVQKLLDDGIDVNWKNDKGFAALIYASARGHVEVVKLLLDRGAQIDIKNNGGVTALMTASYFGKVDCARLLLERGANLSLKAKDGRTAKDWAVKQGYVDIVQLLDEVCMLQISR